MGKAESRIKTIYFLRTVEKKKYNEIAPMFNVSVRTCKRAVSLFRKLNNICDQPSDDLINFYENEMQMLMKRRKNKPDRVFIKYTYLIIELQDKIAELLKLKSATPILNQVQNNTLTIVLPDGTEKKRIKTITEARRSDFLKGE